MDELVLAAMARWPNVPAAYGWLSLSRRGQWRLHPHGQGWGTDAEEPGEAISSPQITAFINRNYLANEAGDWFFQNGPQRVFVRLDGAPWVLRTEPGPQGQPQLTTHTGLDYGTPSHWWLSSDGLLYTQANLGAGLVQDHDLAQLIDMLMLPDGRPLAEALGTLQSDGQPISVIWPPDTDDAKPAPLGLLDEAAIETTLGFIRRPQKPAPTAPGPDHKAKINS